MANLKVYLATYYQSYNYGAYDECELVIVANTPDEALGLALSDVSDSSAKCWSIEELDISAPAVHLISKTSN